VSTLRITRRAADRLRAGHLWVYRSDLELHRTLPGSGELTSLTDSRDIPLGTALYSSASQIAARLVSRTPALTREQYLADLRLRIDAALQLRRELAPVSADNNAHRLLFAEADNLPGIVADRYHDLVLLQLLTQGTAQDDVRAVLVAALREAFAAEGCAPTGAPGQLAGRGGLTGAPGQLAGRGGLTLWERPDPRIRELEQLPAPPPGPLYTDRHLDPSTDCHLDRSSTASSSSGVERPPHLGDAEGSKTTTTFTLNGLHFHYDAASGQKTGAFLDQRLNYAAAANSVRASGRMSRALDICTYQGGFALHLAQVCDRVTGVDASRAALEAADRNLLLNPQLSARCAVDWVEADAFDYLRHLDEQHSLFDAIVLDPPAFAKSQRAAEAALRGYKELNLRALRLLAPGGTLITCSCSHHVSLEAFTAIVASAAADAGRRVQLLETRAAAPDHPEVLTLPETRYLKCLICRVD
jgi:23S rRNA (cytosine1962-C5)-methyltransferase